MQERNESFVLLFRQPSFDYSNASPKEIQALSKRWNDWWKNIDKHDKLSRGPRHANDGKVLKSGGVITDGPFVEIREILGSFIAVKAKNLDDAVTLAHGCPALDHGGSVEVRPVYKHLFQNEFFKMVAVISRLFGFHRIETAEDIVSDILLANRYYFKDRIDNLVPASGEVFLMAAT